MLTASVVARAPAQSAPPILTEVDGLVAPSGYKITETLNQPETLEFSLVPSLQSDSVLTRFLDLTAQGTEIWVYLDSVKIFAGPLVGYGPGLQDGTIGWSVRAAGILDYLRRWRIEPDRGDLAFTDVDQADIAKGMIDYYQDLAYGDYGIDTSNVAITGVTRRRTYEALAAAPISQRLAELAAVSNGFDYWIDPTTREFQVAHPLRGSDRTATIQIDGRSIVTPDAQISIGPEDMVSEGFAVGEDGLVGHATNLALRQNWGRTGFASGFSGVIEQATIDDHAARLAGDRSTQLHTTPSALYSTVFGWNDFGLGDTVEFAYDYGAGEMVEVRRVYSRTLSVSDEGAAEIGVQLI